MMHNDVGGIAVHSIYHTAQAVAPTQKFMSMWRAPKPVIAQVHGWCVGGGLGRSSTAFFPGPL